MKWVHGRKFKLSSSSTLAKVIHGNSMIEYIIYPYDATHAAPTASFKYVGTTVVGNAFWST